MTRYSKFPVIINRNVDAFEQYPANFLIYISSENIDVTNNIQQSACEIPYKCQSYWQYPIDFL